MKPGSLHSLDARKTMQKTYFNSLACSTPANTSNSSFGFLSFSLVPRQTKDTHDPNFATT